MRKGSALNPRSAAVVAVIVHHQDGRRVMHEGGDQLAAIRNIASATTSGKCAVGEKPGEQIARPGPLQ